MQANRFQQVYRITVVLAKDHSTKTKRNKQTQNDDVDANGRWPKDKCTRPNSETQAKVYNTPDDSASHHPPPLPGSLASPAFACRISSIRPLPYEVHRATSLAFGDCLQSVRKKRVRHFSSTPPAPQNEHYIRYGHRPTSLPICFPSPFPASPPAPSSTRKGGRSARAPAARRGLDGRHRQTLTNARCG